MANFTIMRNGLNTEIVGDPHIGQSSEDVTVEVTDDGTYQEYDKKLYYSYGYRNQIYRAIADKNSSNEFVIPMTAFLEPGIVKLSLELSNGMNKPTCNACFIISTDGAKSVAASDILPNEETWQSYIQSYLKSDIVHKPTVDALEKRLDNLILSSGTESSAEVIDARTGYDGTSYDTLGTAVREQISSLKEDLDSVEYYNHVKFVGEHPIYYDMNPIDDGTTFYFKVISYDSQKSQLNFYGMYGATNADGSDLLAPVKVGEYAVVTTSRDYHHLQVAPVPYVEGETSNFDFEYGIVKSYGLLRDFVELQTSVNGLQTSVNGLKTSVNGLQTVITGGNYSNTASATIIDYRNFEIGATYKFIIWGAYGFKKDNLPGVYRWKKDGTYIDLNKSPYREIVGSSAIITVEVADDTNYIRLYADKKSDVDECGCNWILLKEDGARLDIIEEKIKKVQENTLRLKSMLNMNTAKIFKRVVCCGDSYTSGHIKLEGEDAIATNEEFAWPHYMSTMTGNEWINCGCSGCNVLTWQTHERGLPTAQAKGKVQAYVIGLMINDVSDSSRAVPLGDISDIGTVAQTYYGGMSAIIRKLNAISPNAKIFVNTCPKTGAKYTQYNQAVRDIVSAYKATYPVHCIDLEAVKDYYTNSSLTDDYISGHYTAIGYEQFAEIYSYVLSDYINHHISDFQNVHKIEYDS